MLCGAEMLCGVVTPYGVGMPYGVAMPSGAEAHQAGRTRTESKVELAEPGYPMPLIRRLRFEPSQQRGGMNAENPGGRRFIVAGCS